MRAEKIGITRTIRDDLKKACAAVGITYGVKVRGGFRFHDSRRTVKSKMVTASVMDKIIDLMLGYSFSGMMDEFFLSWMMRSIRRS
jgi:hypothetical protein